MNFKSRNLVIQLLKEMMKLQQDGKRDNYTPNGGLSKVGREYEMDIPAEEVGLPRLKIIGSQNQYPTDKSLVGKERIEPALPTPWKTRTRTAGMG